MPGCVRLGTEGARQHFHVTGDTGLAADGLPGLAAAGLRRDQRTVRPVSGNPFQVFVVLFDLTQGKVEAR